MAVLHVQVAHRGELLGASGVENLQHALLAVHLDLLAVRVLDGRIVFLDENALHELDGERGFTWFSVGGEEKLLVEEHTHRLTENRAIARGESTQVTLVRADPGHRAGRGAHLLTHTTAAQHDDLVLSHLRFASRSSLALSF